MSILKKMQVRKVENIKALATFIRCPIYSNQPIHCVEATKIRCRCAKMNIRRICYLSQTFNNSHCVEIFAHIISKRFRKDGMPQRKVLFKQENVFLRFLLLEKVQMRNVANIRRIFCSFPIYISQPAVHHVENIMCRLFQNFLILFILITLCESSHCDFFILKYNLFI